MLILNTIGGLIIGRVYYQSQYSLKYLLESVFLFFFVIESEKVTKVIYLM